MARSGTQPFPENGDLVIVTDFHQSLIHITQGFCAQYIDENGTLHFDVNNTRRYVERILFASAPWQAWAMKVRSVYRWDEPRVTFRWLILYLYLWHTEHIAGFIVRTVRVICLSEADHSLVCLCALYRDQKQIFSNHRGVAEGFRTSRDG